MDLSSPLRSIAPGLDSAVLEVFARTESGLSSTQIARLSARGTRAGQLPVLNRLVDHGLIEAIPANTGYLYRLNRDHVLASAVLAAVASRQEILRRLASAVLRLPMVPVHASLFGSFARGDADADSDLDLLLVTENKVDVHDPLWTNGLQVLCEEVLSWTGNRLETLTFTRSRLAKINAQGDPIVASWVSDSVLVHGPQIDTLLSAGRRKPVRR